MVQNVLAQAIAPTIPDTTLPVNSIILPDGNTLRIDGGTTQGGNLFHSFDRFNLPAGITATFSSGINVENIFTRITGSDMSQIDGTLQTLGSANLFLLNPNGNLATPLAWMWAVLFLPVRRIVLCLRMGCGLRQRLQYQRC